MSIGILALLLIQGASVDLPIAPGRGIGEFLLGSPRQVLEQRLGRSQITEPLPGNGSRLEWYENRFATTLAAYMSGESVQQLEVSSRGVTLPAWVEIHEGKYALSPEAGLSCFDATGIGSGTWRENDLFVVDSRQGVGVVFQRSRFTEEFEPGRVLVFPQAKFEPRWQRGHMQSIPCSGTALERRSVEHRATTEAAWVRPEIGRVCWASERAMLVHVFDDAEGPKRKVPDKLDHAGVWSRDWLHTGRSAMMAIKLGSNAAIGVGEATDLGIEPTNESPAVDARLIRGRIHLTQKEMPDAQDELQAFNLGVGTVAHYIVTFERAEAFVVDDPLGTKLYLIRGKATVRTVKNPAIRVAALSGRRGMDLIFRKELPNIDASTEKELRDSTGGHAEPCGILR